MPLAISINNAKFTTTVWESGWRVESMARCSRRVGSKINSARLKHVLLLRAAWPEAGCSTVRQARPPSCAAAASFAAVRCCTVLKPRRKAPLPACLSATRSTQTGTSTPMRCPGCISTALWRTSPRRRLSVNHSLADGCAHGQSYKGGSAAKQVAACGRLFGLGCGPMSWARPTASQQAAPSQAHRHRLRHGKI